MKTYKKLLINIVISLLLQVGVLYYLNTYFLTQSVPVTSTEVPLEDPSGIKKTKFNLPDGVNRSSIKISDDSMYMAYTQNDSLKVMNISTGKVHDISEDGMIISDTVEINGKTQSQPCYEWVPNRDRLIVGYISKSLMGGRSLKLISYDPVYNQKQEQENMLDVIKGRYITQIQSSPITGAFYIKIDGNNSNTKIFRIDRNGDSTKLETGVSFVDKMSELQNQDKIYYENSKGNSNETTETVVKSAYGQRRYIVSKNTFDINGIYTSKFGQGHDKISDSSLSLKIIGVNEEDHVFYAKFDENHKLIEILYTMEQAKGFYPISLPMKFYTTSVGMEDIFIVPNKGLCINDKYLHKFTEINTKKTFTYNGDLLKVTNDYIISIENDKVYLKKFK